MKASAFSEVVRRHRGRGRPTAGIALLLVLGVLVLVSIIVIGMLTSARTNLATAHNYAAGNDVKVLGDTAVNLVIAQIRSATSDDDLAWISQPGLIRTFSPEGQQDAFKLYSSYSMREGSSYDPGSTATLTAEVPADWFDRPNEFIDLNRPVDVDGEPVYPIVDPTQVGLVEGFDFDATGRTAAADSLAENPLPMPVRWIYLGKDGEFMTASDPERHEAVARLAFWTDDDTSKININTAAGGIYFDTPAVNSKEDHMLGRTQPIAQEYQRWPGHPATTSLAPALKSLRDIADPVTRSEEVAKLIPRIGWGGSEGGEEYAWLTRNLGQTDMDRLFASLDEFYYGLGVDGAGNRKPFEFSSGQTLEDSGQKVPQLDFFLTAHSKAPELNLFNRPRVSLWPFNEELVQTADGSDITPEDRLIRMATEFGGTQGDGNLDYSKRKRFYFQRKDAWDPFVDYDDISANQALLEYLRDLTARPVPSANVARSGGPSRSFKTKFGQANIDQLLIGMWDYIRSDINTVNQSYEPVGLATYSFPQNHDTEKTGFNDVAPLIVAGTGTQPAGKGLGRSTVPAELILQFYNAGEDFEKDTSGDPIDLHDNANPSDLTPDGIPDYVIRKVRMVLLINFQMPVDNLYRNNPRFQVEITGSSFGVETAISGQPGIKVRRITPAVTPWSDSGIWGFPNSGGALRTVCYVDGYGFGSTATRGGQTGVAYAMYAPVTNRPDLDATKPESITTAFKVLSNGSSPLSSEDLKQLARFDSSSREDVYYPFVSDILEFRLPQKPAADPSASDPPEADTPMARNLKAEGVDNHGFDFFEAQFVGGTMDITIYPGLKADASALSPVAVNWQSRTANNYLLETSVAFPSTIIPLPRLGRDDVEAMKKQEWEDGVPSGDARRSLPTPSLQEMANYYLRGQTANSDLVMVVPIEGVDMNGGPKIYSSMMTDVFRSMALTGAAPVFGDLRLAATARDIPGTWWEKHPYYDTRGAYLAMGYIPEQTVGVGEEDPAEYSNISPPGLSALHSSGKAIARWGRLNSDTDEYSWWLRRTVSPLTTASSRQGSPDVGDFSLGYGSTPPGALVVGPDTGAAYLGSDIQRSPYFAGGASRAGTDDNVSDTGYNGDKNVMGLLFSPFKQAPSPVIFGTLPARSDSAWETLLFNPNPAGGKDTHRGWTETPRDHFLLDLFWMPVVEPYAISENFATAGKVNLNYQIAPFTYIDRETGLYALLDTFTANAKAADVEGAILAVPESAATTIRKQNSKMNVASNTGYRHFVDIGETLKGFDARFAANDPFVSASEITEMFLVPEGRTLATAEAFWDDKTLTGDDKLEAPYNALYPRVTTRSNTFTVHYWVERLAPTKSNDDAPVVIGRYRGSTIIERYIDQNVEDYGDPLPTSPKDGIDIDAVFPPMLDLYKFRKVGEKQFAP